MEDTLLDEINAPGSSPITQTDVENGKRILAKYTRSWNKKNKPEEFPRIHLRGKILICQILLRVGADVSILRTLGSCPTDRDLPLRDDVVSTLLPDNPEAQRLFKEEQKRCFGEFLFERKETAFEADTFLPFRPGEGKGGEGTYAKVDNVQYVHDRGPEEPTSFARKCPKATQFIAKAIVFEHEIKILEDLRKHHHIVEYVGSYKHGSERAIILYPFANGGNLEQYLHKESDDIDQALLMKLFGCLSIGLNFLGNNCNLRHKDIKTSNVLIHNSSVIFTDFGSAFQFLDGADKTHNTFPGLITQRYAAPEILKSDHRSIKTDLFALGCIFAEILTVLTQKTVQDLRRHLGNSSTSSYGANVPKLRAWLKSHCTEEDFELPLKWCLQMIEEDMDNRPHIVELVESMRKECRDKDELETFFCAECISGFKESKIADLAAAVQQGSKLEAAQLVEKVADIDIRDQFGLTPLSYAVRRGSTNIAKMLLDHNADTTAAEPTEGITPLLWAVKSRHIPMVKLLLSKGSDVRAEDILGRALSIAARNRDPEMVKYLLNEHANVSYASSMSERTALHQAAQSECADVVELLIEAGAEILAKDRLGRTPLHLAAANNCTSVVELLLKKMKLANVSEEVDVVDLCGWTPLHQAAHNGFISVIKLLVKSGAAIYAIDNKGQTPGSLAGNNDHDMVIEFFRQEEENAKHAKSLRQRILAQKRNSSKHRKIRFVCDPELPDEV